MDCRTTQKNFQNFINYRLEDEETLRFIDHVRSCPACMHELDLYYTMFVSLRQLENNETLTADYSRELQEDIKDRYDDIKEERFKETLREAGAIVFLVVITGLGLISGLI